MRVGNEDVTTNDQRLAKLKAGHWRISSATSPDMADEAIELCRACIYQVDRVEMAPVEQ